MKETAGSKTEIALLKLGAWIVGGILTLIVIGWVGHHFYRSWQEQHLDRQARVYLEKKDYRSAIITAQRALQLNPSNAAACRIVAEISERLGSRVAIEWRRRIVDLVPEVAEEKLAWARAALRFNQPETAAIALDQIEPSQRSSAAYHDVASQLALSRGDLAEAKKHALEAVRLDPLNTTYQLHLAMEQVQSKANFAEAEQGREVLSRLTRDPQHRVEAFRILLEDALREFHEGQAVELARQLKNLPEAVFRDQLLYLRSLQAARAPEFDSELKSVKVEAQKSSDAAADLISWLATGGRVAEAIEWGEKLPVEVSSKIPVPLALATAFVTAKAWHGLQGLVQNAAWGDQDFLRLALLARALREQGDEAGFKTQWANAMKKAPKGEQAMILSQTVLDWGWEDEALSLLWGVNDNPGVEEKALRTLYAHYSRIGDAASLYRVALHLLQIRPDDSRISNNVAQLSLLLNFDSQRGHKLARELYENNPSNPAYGSTYAFSLYLKGDVKQALQVIRGFAESQLQEPAVAAYYGIVLAAAGEKELALSFLDRGSQARLLPEERALVSKAQRDLVQ